jgi:hypothetical protein
MSPFCSPDTTSESDVHMHIEERGTIFDATQRPPSQRVAIFSSLCPTSSGSIFSVFQVASRKQAADSRLGLARSRDGGRTWTDMPAPFETVIGGVPGSLSGAEMVETQPGWLILIATWFDRSDPERPLFDPVSEGILHCKSLLAESRDDGASWSPWRELRFPGLKACAGTGPLLKWADGTIAFPFESYKEYDDPGPKQHAAWFVPSRDGGQTFGAPVLVARHPEDRLYYWDQRLCLNPEGEITAMFWTHDLTQKCDLNVHWRRFSLAHNTFEAAPIRETTLPGQIAAPLWLKDGRLLAFVVNRGKPGTMTLWSSRDGGRTWPESLVVYVHDEAALASDGKKQVDYAQYWEDMAKWSFGHPAIRSMPDGRVLLAWYAGTPECMSMRCARVNVGV